ncbi:UNVERIFIED_CONTAM: hypothetical protein FKN15_075432 [Acipenser sinensis]
MADRKKSRRMGSTRKGQRRLQNPECRLGDEEGPLEGVMEESAEKAQETPDELHKIQEVQGERGFSTQGGRQKLLVDPPVSVGELEQGLGWEGSGFITSKDLPSGLREFVEVQPCPSVKERGEERLAPAPMLSQPQSTEPPGGAEDEENAMVHRKRKLGSTRKLQRRMQNPEGRLGGEEEPPGGVMEDSEEKVQESNDPLHKIQEFHWERGFSTQWDSQKEELDHRLKMEVASQNISPPPWEFVEVQPSPSVKERGEERLAPAPMLSQPQSTEPPGGAEDEENAMKEELDHRLKMEVASQNISPPPWEFVEVQPSPSVKEKGEEEERVSPAPMFSQPESTKLPRGAEDEDNAMVHRKRKLGSTRKGQRRMQILEGQLVGEEGPPGGVMEESEEKLQETPDELHKIQEVQEERGFSTQGDSQKAEGHLEDVMEESEVKVLETPAELHKIQEVHGERGFSTQGDSQKLEGPLEDVMEETEEKLQETPDELHKIQEVHGERGFSTQVDHQKEDGPLEDVMEKSEEKVQETPDPFHKIQEVHGERGFSTQKDSQKEELDHRLKMEVASQNISPPPWEFVEVQPSPSVKEKGEEEERKEELDHRLKIEVASQNISPPPWKFVEVQPSPSVKEKGEEERVAPAPMLSQPQSTEHPRGAEDEDNTMVHRKRKLGSTRKGHRRMQNPEGLLRGEGPLEGVMEESGEKAQETPGELHKIQEVQGERGFSTQGGRQKLLVDPPVSVGELEQGLGWEGSGFITSKDLPSGLREFLAGQPSASVKEEERVTPAPMLCQPQSTKDKDSTVTDRKRKLGSSRRGPKRLQNLGGRQGGRREGQETTNALRKIQELFQGSDGEGTGIITRAEMQEVCGDLPLTLEELDQVFDRLDREGSGYITSEDLSAALSEYEGSIPGTLRSGQSEIWKLWAELRQNEPHLLGNLEEFVAKVTSQIREAREEKEGLELTLQRRIVEHNLEVRQLYEEMEQQISREKERLHREAVTLYNSKGLPSFKKSRSQGKELKKELDKKTDEVQHLVEVQNELEESVHTLRIRQHATCSENETLRRTNRELEGQLEGIREQLQEARARLQDMRSSEAHRQQQQQQAQGEKRQDTEHTSGEPERSSGTEVTKTEAAATEQKKTENSQPAELIRAGSVLGSYIQDDFSAGAPPKDEEPTNTNVMTCRRVISIEEDPLPDLITPTRSKLGQERSWEQEGREILSKEEGAGGKKQEGELDAERENGQEGWKEDEKKDEDWERELGRDELTREEQEAGMCVEQIEQGKEVESEEVEDAKQEAEVQREDRKLNQQKEEIVREQVSVREQERNVLREENELKKQEGEILREEITEREEEREVLREEEREERKQEEEVLSEEVTLQLKEVLHEEVKPIEQEGMVLREEVSETKEEGKPLTKEMKEPEHGHEGVSEKQHGGEELREDVNENQQEEERSEVVEQGARAAILSKSEELSEREQGGEVLSEVGETKLKILIEEDRNGEEQTENEKQAEPEGEILGSEVKECKEEEVLCEEVKEIKHEDEGVSENQQEEVTSEAVQQVTQAEETQSNTKHSILGQEDEIQPREEEKEFVHEGETGEKEQDREELGERDGQTKQEVEEEEIRDKKNRGEVASEEVVGTKQEDEIQIEEKEQEGDVHSEERENEEEGEEEERRLSEEEEQSKGKEQGGEEGQIDQEFGKPSEGEKIARGDKMEIMDRDDENPEKEHDTAVHEGEVVRELKEIQLSKETERPRVKEQNGLDSCIHTLLIGDRRFVLQLWDTAGQERYHSITKQVFRKADGVVVMYDITSAQSFTAVRYWLTCIQEGAGDEVVVVLLGNKSDSSARRAVPTHEGERLAQENRILFHECSAASGYNVTESMINLAR